MITDNELYAKYADAPEAEVAALPESDRRRLYRLVGWPRAGYPWDRMPAWLWPRWAPERIDQGPWWWLSFADPDLPDGRQFLGVVIMNGDTVMEAITEAHVLGVNPGGECSFAQIPEEHVPPLQYRRRLLNYAELAESGLLE